MKHFGGIANVGRSHVQTMCILGRELQRRGHRFTFFGTASQVRQARTEGVNCVILGAADPAADAFARLEKEQNVSMGAYLAYMKAMATFLCENAPTALRRERIDLLLADQEEAGAATAADLSGIPYVSICSSVPLNEDRWVPPNFVPWQASTGLWPSIRNTLAYRFRNLVVAGLNRKINRYREAGRLSLYGRPDDSFSGLVQISQLVKEIEFARHREDPRLQYVGPFQRQAKRDIPFPFESLDGRPLIYASFGTAKHDVTAVFRDIASVCADLPVQLAITLGGAKPEAVHAAFPGNPIVVSYAPQLELLRRASVFITHGGVNSVMESLSMGVPLIVFPQHGDQFGMAARVVHHQAGVVAKANPVNAQALRDSIERVLRDPIYRNSAVHLQKAIARTRGAAQAADLIEAQARSHRKSAASRG